MSRSFNDFHKAFRNEKCPRTILKVKPNGKLIFRRRKIIPYGSKGYCGYGGEEYIHKYNIEILGDIVDKKAYRRKNRQNLKKEIKEL